MHMENPKRGIRKSWALVAVVIIAAFAAGIFVDSQFLGSSAGNNIGVSDTYPVGDCIGPCPQHGYIFSSDLVTVTITHLGREVFQSTSTNLITTRARTR